MSHVSEYLERLSDTTPQAVSSVKDTIAKLRDPYLDEFTYKDHVVGLLLGQVQSGKTGQMFGVMAAAADSGFELFLVLTSGMTALQTQTYERAEQNIDSFIICNENDEVRFFAKKIRKPTVIILKKNAKVLEKWKNHLASSGYCKGRPIFIIDDEADATSLNTKINNPDDEKSTINKHLEEIKKLCTSSFYLQVTATPQPILLQSVESGWKPSFVHYFPPGEGYLGGSFFYTRPQPYTNKYTSDNELAILLETEDIPEGLKESSETYLITAAHLLSNGAKVCNFLIHPSSRIDDHSAIFKKTKIYVEQVLSNLNDEETIRRLEKAYVGLRESKPEILDFNRIISNLKKLPNIHYVTMNSGKDSETAPNIDTGLNVVVGGNSLGRGVTFKGLQTVYYCRYAKNPQADTFWQHSRMFGYDRDRSLMRLFMPRALFNLFAEINISNEVLYDQISDGNIEKLQLMLSPGIRPTRNNVIDRSKLDVLVGGVNYFPPLPDQSNVFEVDKVLERYNERIQFHKVDSNEIIKILEKFKDDKINNWNISSFISALKSLKTSRGFIDECILIVRRGRDIGQSTGTMLSEDDRKLGSKTIDKPVITFYRNTGNSNKGWDGVPFWMPNLKLPKGKIFYATYE